MNRAAITAALLMFITAAAAAPARPDNSGVVPSMFLCAKRLRDIPEKDKAFKTPEPCEKAAEADSAIAPDGKTISIDNSWITSDIDAIRTAYREKCAPCGMSRSAERKRGKSKKDDDQEQHEDPASCDVCADGLAEFKTLRQALSNLSAAIEHSAESISLKTVSPSQLASDKAGLKEILAKDEYKKHKPEAKKEEDNTEWEWYRNLKEWIKKRLASLIPKSRAPQVRAGPGISVEALIEILRAVVSVVIILAVALLVVLIALKFKRTLSSEAAEGDGDEDEDAPAANVKSMLSEAETFRRKGEFRLAIRSLFLAFLRLLEQKGLVVFIKNKTNREYLRELKAKKSVGPEIETMNLLFEESWYGMKDCGESEYAEFLQVYEECKRKV